MTTFIQYDPIFRNLITLASVSNPDDTYRAYMASQDLPFIEVPDVTLPFDDIYVTEELELAERAVFTPDMRPPSIVSDEPYEIPALNYAVPEGTVCDPPPGTILTEGQTQIWLRAPGYKDYLYEVRVWTAEHEKASLVAWAANRRWELEQAGAMWQGHRVATDDRSKVMIMGSVLSAQMNPAWTTVWQFMDGSSAVVGPAEVVGISAAMGGHVSGLFARFEEARLGIEAGTITTTDEVEAILVAGS